MTIMCKELLVVFWIVVLAEDLFALAKGQLNRGLDLKATTPLMVWCEVARRVRSCTGRRSCGREGAGGEMSSLLSCMCEPFFWGGLNKGKSRG